MQNLSAVSDTAALEAQEDRLRLGLRVVEAREKADLSQRDLAARLVRRRGRHGDETASFEKAVSSMQRTLRRTENGHNTPRGELLLAIADETGVGPEHFISERPEENDELRRRAKEMIAPFQRRDGRRAFGRVSASGRTKGSG